MGQVQAVISSIEEAQLLKNKGDKEQQYHTQHSYAEALVFYKQAWDILPKMEQKELLYFLHHQNIKEEMWLLGLRAICLGGVIHENLSVCYFKLKQYDKTIEHAHYVLGIW